jgi:CelD/BcsL family acetyltransferase involved in cellulose biosynthesis
MVTCLCMNHMRHFSNDTFSRATSVPVLLLPERQTRLTGAVVARDSLPDLIPAWEDLCRRCAEDNVYYSPKYAFAVINHLEKRADLRFAVVWDGPELVAFLPIMKHGLQVPVLQPVRQAWKNTFTFSCMPLLDKARKDAAADALLDVLASVNRGEWVIPTINTQGEACQAIMTAIARKGLPWRFANQFERAVLESGMTFDAHMKVRVPPKRRRELARNRRRLEELGMVRHASYCSADGLREALSAFLAIEASGWKGKRGTALACHERTRSFAAAVFTGDEDPPLCRADVLTLNGKPIAVGLVAFAGRTGFSVKCTYDEAYRSYSVGLLLEIEVIRSFLAERWADRLDAGTDGTHVIDSLWSGQMQVSDLMFSLSPAFPEMRLSALALEVQLQRTIKATLKRWLRPNRGQP